ncbi:MAG: Flagellar biosynthesis protein FlhA [Thermocaproicibacter melissae]|uniref:flagellar biosynthesis protein FlhA n=1 Tax=Thermocaproicibacter melissae TaxID=2966552 RepID=UPI0024B12D4B|nr:flagellar biosynthesis protein FlhA [Thermocaproicibacter melissae]WBY64331.1 flagellar biosynthesis protein FlhA [Thermocaproicibacter melissae]
MKKLFNNAVAFFVILIIALVVIPLPTQLLDVMFILNITLSLMVLLLTMYVHTALDFSVFPSILLIATLFRLALNISSTRQILTNNGYGGEVIKTFGSFVLQGNIVVGFIVFLIIVLVNFLVITKGAERVSEVAARFRLDAMPGKQMAIDADLNSGLIDEKQARERRADVQREAEFYGAMDGASKFVKGDAIMAIVVTFINLIAGIIIGMVQGGKSFDEVLNIYTIASVGDGLVSQVPALLISTATGMIVTRAASNSTLGKDVAGQFVSQPIVIIIAGFALLAMCLIPGMPILQVLVLSGLMLALGFTILRRHKAEELQLAPAAGEAAGSAAENEVEYYKNIDNIYNLLPLDAIEMDFGYSLIPLVDERSGSSFIERLVMFRKQFAIEMGMVVPAVRLRDSASLNPNQYVIKIKGEEVARGEILMDYYLALDPGNLTGEIDGIDTIEPAYGIPSKWITPDKKDLAEIYGYTVIDPLSVVITHLSETVRKHACELLSRQDVSQILENLKKYNEPLVNDVVPGIISQANLQKVLCCLLKEGVPIRDMETILETISNHATVHDPEMLTEYVRQALRRTITRQWSEGGKIRVITLDSEVEKTIINSITKNEHGTYLALDPQMTQKIITKLSECIANVKDVISTPIILTSPVVRLYFSKLLQQFYPKAVVLSFNELENNVQIQAVANIAVD